MKNLYRNFRKVRIIQLVILIIITFGPGTRSNAQTGSVPPPTSFRITFDSHNSVKLVWTYSGEAASSFAVERKVNSGSFSQLATVSGTTNTYTNTGLAVGSTYTYRIKTKKGTVFSATTREISIKVPDNKGFIPSELQMAPEGIASFSPIEMVIPWTTFAAGNTFDVFQTPPCLTGQYYIGFELGYDLGDFNTEADWKADLQLSFLIDGVTKWTKPLSISSLSGTWTGEVFHDAALFCGGNYKFKIHSKTETGPVPVARVRLKEKLYRKVGNTFDVAQVPTLTVTYAPGVAALSWTAPNVDFREYDLEWVFISGHDAYTGNTAAGAFAHREGVGVRLASNSYTHPIYYPQGKLYYRVRAVGYNPDFPDRKILGNWSYGPNAGTAITNQQTAYNWQVRTDFVEGGRYKKTVSYLDGTMRPRQQVSTMSGGAYTVVSETWYDFEGREAVQFLPSPDPATDLKFRPKYNAFKKGVAAITPEVDYGNRTKNKYHYDNEAVQNSAIETASGAGKYYSSGNTMSMVNKNYLPQAEGYGAVFSEYLSDPTGRVKKQGQPGSRFKIDGANTTRKFYAQAFPEELIRLFGANVGDAVHYRKEVIVDPNNQASIQYINQEGQVVATALAGNSPPNVTPLAAYAARESAGWGAVVYDLISHNKPQGSSKLVDASFINSTANTPYTFAYALTGIGSDLDQVGCESCEFTLSMSLVDPDGLLVTLPSVSGDEEPLAEVFKKTFTATDCQVNTDFSPINISLALPKIGEYRIIKELKVKEKSYSEILSEIRSSTVFQQEKLAVENAAGQDLGDCEICDETSPEADMLVLEALNGLVEAELGTAYSQVREAVLAGMTAGEADDPATVEAAIMAHPDYCRYELMKQNTGAREHELKLVQISTMSQAKANGYYPIQNKDPFYMQGGIGAADYNTINGKLGNINLGNGIRGSLPALVDPLNKSAYVNSSGTRDANGFHVLYYDLFRKHGSGQLTDAQFNAALDSAQWRMYSSLYSQTSRDVKINIGAIKGCTAFLKDLLHGNELPRTVGGIEEWTEQTGLLDPVSEEELDQVLAMVQGKCPGDYTGAESNTMRNSLESYLNKDREGNFFNLVLEEDLGDPSLVPLANVLQSKGCSLAGVSTPNPLICLTWEVVDVPVITGDPGNPDPGSGEDPGPGPCTINNNTNSRMAFDPLANTDLGMLSPGLDILEEIERQSDLDMQRIAEEMDRKYEELADELMIMPSPVISLPKVTVPTLGGRNNLRKRSRGSNITLSKRKGAEASRRNTGNVNSRVANTAAAPLPSQAEYRALMDLYQATGGANWTNNYGWSTANPNVVQEVESWYGVVVDKTTGRVTHLHLSYNNLTGQIPKSIKDLQHLKWLQFYQNSLSGVLDDWVVVFPQLVSFSVALNNFTGPIPLEIGQMPHLEEVFLRGNALTGTIPSNITNLKKVRWLVLYDNQLTGSIPSTIGNMTSLEYLYLYRNQLSGSIPSSIGSLKNIKFLGLHSNSFSGPIPSTLANLPKLETILFHINQFSGPIPASLATLTSLKTLWLWDNKFTGTLPLGIASLSNLESFMVQDNSLEGTIPSSYGNLSKLMELRLDRNKLLTGDIPPELGNLTNLRDLYLSDNKLSGTIPDSFCNLTKLNRLRLFLNDLHGTLPPCLLDKKLGAFYISYNYYTFGDLNGTTHGFHQLSDYSPQKSRGEAENIRVYGSGGATLRIDAGKGLPKPSTYEWFKNGVSISGSSASNDKLPVNCDEYERVYSEQYGREVDCFECEGIYVGMATNPDYPGVKMVSSPKTITVISTKKDTVCTAYQLDPAFNPWLASVSYVPDWEEVAERCLAERDTLRAAIRGAAVEELEHRWMESYFRSVSTSCLEDASESLNMTVTNKEYHYTLYYYDQANNLVQTVPPKGVKLLNTAQISQVKSGTAVYPSHELPTRYRYNSKDQLVWQSSPDGGISQFWYNAIGQLRLSQNAEQRLENAYSYSKYDRLGRVIETGELLTQEEQSVLKEKLRELDFPQRPAYTCQDITITGYDNRKTGLHLVFSQEHLRNRVSYTAQLEKGKTDTLLTAYSYDPHGNVKGLLQQIPGLAPKITSYKYDQISGNVNYVFYQPGTPEQLVHHYTYDADNRIETVRTSTDGHLWSTDATYYYYPHGPLARVELGEHKVQGMDYYYTLQGWLKGVNMPGGGNPGGDGTGSMRTGKDAVAFALGYYSGDYVPITSGRVLTDSRDALWTRNNTVSGNTGLYNGNISWMNTELAGSQDEYDMQAMLYKYDQLHRIVEARSLREYSSNFVSRTATTVKPYDADYTYDANGNLLTLKRHDSRATLLHDFNYEYYPGTNRLRKVVGKYSPVVPDTKVYNSNPLVPDGQQYRAITVADGAVLPSGQTAVLKATESIVLQPGSHIRGGSTFSASIEEVAGVPIPADGQYKYDAIGNLVSDNGEGITDIEWTPGGKVRKVVKSSGDPIEFRYDASGNRVEKKQGSGITRYIRDASGNVMAVYEAGTLSERPIYGSSRLGNLAASSAPGYRTAGNKNYELSNHLGNVLAVVSDRIHMESDSTWAEVISRSDYYPFGMPMGGRSENSTGYKYGFGSHEKDVEISGSGNHYSFGDYGYNPIVGRRWQVDPVEIVGISGYAVYKNNPIVFIDPDGRSATLPDWYKNQDGDIKWFANSSKGFSDAGGNSWSNIGTELIEFNGTSLTYNWQTGNEFDGYQRNVETFGAVSGKGIDPTGYWGQTRIFDYSGKRQQIRDVGPVPEGNYSINKRPFIQDVNESGFQNYSDLSMLEQIASGFGRSNWPGGTYSWGDFRWKLLEEGARTFGRDNFYLHGGSLWGSKGCIDCGAGINAFTRSFMDRNLGNDKVYVKVRYPRNLRFQIQNNRTKQGIRFISH